MKTDRLLFIPLPLQAPKCVHTQIKSFYRNARQRLHDGQGQDLGAELHLHAAQDQDLRPELLHAWMSSRSRPKEVEQGREGGEDVCACEEAIYIERDSSKMVLFSLYGAY